MSGLAPRRSSDVINEVSLKKYFYEMDKKEKESLKSSEFYARILTKIGKFSCQTRPALVLAQAAKLTMRTPRQTMQA